MLCTSVFAHCKTFTSQRITKQLGCIAFVFIIAIPLRLHTFAYDLPYIYHPDEPLSIAIAQGLFKSGDPNPHFFNYPSLFFYANALAYLPYYWLGWLGGVFSSVHDIQPPRTLVMGVSLATTPSAVVLARAVSFCSGIATLFLVWRLGGVVGQSEVVGILSAAILAVSLPHVEYSRLATPDCLATTLICATLLPAAQFVIAQRRKYIIWAAVFAGLCAATKYNCGLAFFAVLLAHLLVCKKSRRGTAPRDSCCSVIMITGTAVIFFLLGTPYIVITPNKFLSDLRFEMKHYATGHAGMEGDALRWYLSYLWQSWSVLIILAAFGLMRSLWTRSRAALPVAVFVLIYLMMIITMQVRNDRTILPVIPALGVFAAYGYHWLVSPLSHLPSRGYPTLRLANIAAIVLLLFGVFKATLTTVSENIRRSIPDSRKTAREWIVHNFPPGSKIALEAYSPYVDPARFEVVAINRIVDHTPEWYIERDFDYIVMSEGMFGRYLREPQRYPISVQLYEKFFRTFKPVRIFRDGGYEVRIYKVRS